MARSSNPKLPQRLIENLQFLGLRKIPQVYQEIAKRAAQEGWAPEVFLDRLITQEAADKYARCVQNRIRQARFPLIKTVDQFDWKHPKKINRSLIQRLFTLDFIEKKQNVILLGNSGVGKTHLALALGYEACQQGISTRFSTAIGLIHEFSAAMADGRFPRMMKRVTLPKLLVLDELGYLPVEKKGVDLLFQIISARYETGSILVTTNRPFKDWGQIFNDNTLASAVVDRLTHHAEIIIIEGESYRMKK